jgi:hypothetical protein
MDKGWKNRATGSTLMNADSSRSGIQAFQTGALNGADFLMTIPCIEQSKIYDDFSGLLCLFFSEKSKLYANIREPCIS